MSLCTEKQICRSSNIGSVQSLSRVRLCNPMVCSMPGLPVHHQLLEFTQTHVHRVGDAIQPSHPLSSPSSPALNLSQHQGLFKLLVVCLQTGVAVTSYCVHFYNCLNLNLHLFCN